MIIGLVEETMKDVLDATRSDCVRRPIGLRSPPDWIAFAVHSDCVRVTKTFRKFF